jgi:hypothetical protein
MAESKLSKDITTEELMALDYRYNYTDDELRKDWKKLVDVTQFKTGSQFKPGMKLCQHFFPNFWNIENENGLSFAKAWQDPVVMDKVRVWGLQGMSQLWLSWIRRAVYMASGLPNSSFYRPHFTKQVTMMTGKKTGTLFDPCAGWGGRMLGTVANGWNYVACDPNVETFENLNRLIDFLDIRDRVKLYNIPAENFDFDSLNSVDVVLTSPPYFNLEVYTKDGEQSYNKHGTYDKWLECWLQPLMVNCLNKLADDGISAWNVMNFKKNDIVKNVLDIHEKNGYTMFDTVGFQSPLANIRNLKNKDVTYLFRK